MDNHIKRDGVRLHIVPPAQPEPDDRARVARALLDRWFPVHQVLGDQALASLGDDMAAVEELESDPRYLIGRLSQALTALLKQEVPPLDATAQLLGEAIEDAATYRRRVCRNCPSEGVCARCAPDWRRAEAYEALWRELGLIGALPRPRPRLKAVTR
jgi:hypothetical protein